MTLDYPSDYPSPPAPPTQGCDDETDPYDIGQQPQGKVITMNDHLYSGDKTPQETWGMLSAQPDAVLIDVRTSAEWSFVGVPDLSGTNREITLIAWQEFPGMAVNPDFVEQVKGIAPDPATPLLFLCRSGVRSQAAADAMTAAGYTACFNVLEGFEGDRDNTGHRSAVGGWKFRGLPWKQR